MEAEAGAATDPKAHSERIRGVALVFFALLFVLLFAAVGIASGIGSSEATLPAGAVAVIDGVPRDLGTITEAEFEQQMRQYEALQSPEGVPRPGDPEFEQMKDEALDSLIGAVWLQGQAEELGIEVSGREVAEAIDGDEVRDLLKAQYTQKTIAERVKLELVMPQIQEKLAERAAEPSSAEIRGYYEEDPEGKSFAEVKAKARAALEAQNQQEVYSEVDVDFPVEWRARTHCAEGFVVELCAEHPAFGRLSWMPAACLEAEPETAVEACPAPVPQRTAVVPGSVSLRAPEGERAVQAPVAEAE